MQVEVWEREVRRVVRAGVRWGGMGMGVEGGDVVVGVCGRRRFLRRW